MSFNQFYMESYNHFALDELNSTGNKVRIQNKLKAKNMMLLAINNIDEGTCGKVKNLLLSLTFEDRRKLTQFINAKKFLSRKYKDSFEQKIIDKIARINMTSTPANPYLLKLLDEFNKNLDQIDKLKIKTNETSCFDHREISKLMVSIEELNKRNLHLIELVNNYRMSQQKTVKAS